MTGLEVSIQVVGWLGLACWIACFIWMHHISKRQDALLKEMKEVLKRIEYFSEVEHDLIREVHPQVSEIKRSVDEVAEAIESR